MIWFRKEPNLQWIHAAGEREETQEEVARALAAMEIRPDGPDDRESRPAAAQPNIQDVFLNYARREKLPVHIRLMDGTDFEGRVKNFDRFAVIVEHTGADHMVFKHAIATIRSPRTMSNYYSSHEA